MKTYAEAVKIIEYSTLIMLALGATIVGWHWMIKTAPPWKVQIVEPVTKGVVMDEQLKAYVGAKVVKARPMDLATFLIEIKNVGDIDKENEDGYMVVYDDGYVSWSPKAVFERCYREVTQGEANLVSVMLASPEPSADEEKPAPEVAPEDTPGDTPAVPEGSPESDEKTEGGGPAMGDEPPAGTFPGAGQE